MDTWLIGLLLMVVGFIFLLVEVATPGQTFMAIPGTVLVVLGIISMAVPTWLFSEFWYAPVVTALIAAPVTLITIWFYRMFGMGGPPMTTVGSSLIGRQGVVTVPIIPDTLRGKVRIGNQIWSAVSDKTIPGGTKVEVVSSEGVHVHVEKIEDIAKWEAEQMGKET
jgi:membrane-bound ClpP family serine protease